MQQHSYGYKQSDMVTAKNMIDLHQAKLSKAIDANNWPQACSAIRAIQAESEHASRIATSLSLNAHLQTRFPRSNSNG